MSPILIILLVKRVTWKLIFYPVFIYIFTWVLQYVLMHQAIWGDSEQATWSKHDLCIMSKCRRRIPWHIPLFYLEKHEGRNHNVWHFHLSDIEQSKKYMSRPMQRHRNSHAVICCLFHLIHALCPFSDTIFMLRSCMWVMWYNGIILPIVPPATSEWNSDIQWNGICLKYIRRWRREENKDTGLWCGKSRRVRVH